MLCQEIMKHPVKWVAMDDTARTAARVMRDENIGFLPVCDRSGSVVGTVTDRDLTIRLIAEGLPPDSLIGDVMTRDVVECRPTDELQHAEQLMSLRKVSRILCTDQAGRLMGIVSITDVAKHDDGWRVARTVRKITSREAH